MPIGLLAAFAIVIGDQPGRQPIGQVAASGMAIAVDALGDASSLSPSMTSADEDSPAQLYALRWTQGLPVFEQDFDSAMTIWALQDDAVARLCNGEQRVTRASQVSDSSQQVMEPYRSPQPGPRTGTRTRTRKRRRVNDPRMESQAAPPRPVMAVHSGHDEAHENVDGDATTDGLIEQEDTRGNSESAKVDEEGSASVPDGGGDDTDTGVGSTTMESVRMREDVVVGGFQTGSNKPIQVSRKRMRQYETRLLAEEPSCRNPGDDSGSGVKRREHSEDANDRPTGDGVVSVGFQTGSGRACKVSSSLLRRYQADLFKGDEDNSGKSTSGKALENDARSGKFGTVTDVGTEATVDAQACGFQTGSGRKLAIPKPTMRHYEALLFGDTYPDGDQVVDRRESFLHGEQSNVNRSFAAKNDKDASFKHQAGSSSGTTDFCDPKAFTGLSVVNGVGIHAPNEPRIDCGMTTSGFKTGSGKTVSISTSKLQEYETRIFNSVDITTQATAILPAAYDSERNDARSDTMILSGFQTGSGRQVAVSMEHFARYKADLVGNVVDNDQEIAVVCDEAQLHRTSDRTLTATQPIESVNEDTAGFMTGCDKVTGVAPSLFQTASGRGVTVSEDKLNELRDKLFGDSRPLNPQISDKSTGDDPMPIQGEFQTGRGQLVLFSAAKLRQYEKMLVVDQVESSAPPGNPTFLTSMRGSSTGGTVGRDTHIHCGKAMDTSLSSGHSKMHSSNSILCSEGNESENTRSHLFRPSRAFTDKTSANISGDGGIALTAGNDKMPLTQDPQLHHCTELTAPCSCTTSARNLVNSTSSRLIPSRIKVKPTANECPARNPGHEPQMLRKAPSVHSNHQSFAHKKTSSSLRDTIDVVEHKQQQRGTNSSVGKLWRNSRLRPDESYSTPGKENMPQPRSQSLTGKKFRPPLPSKTAPQKTFVTSIPQKSAAPCTAAAIPRAFVYQEAMRISRDLLIEASTLDTFGVLGDEDRSHRLQQIDAVSAQNVRFPAFGSSVSDCDFSTGESAVPSQASSLSVGYEEMYAQMQVDLHFGLDKSVTKAWFANHYRWIVWKLAQMELQFTRFLFGKYLTRSQVMHQLCRRFEKDIVQAQRSVVKKILHRDASSASCAVLRVAAVLPFRREKGDDPPDITLPPFWNLSLVLTDGWYGIYAVPDLALAESLWKYHRAGRLTGMKIVTWNASLHNVADGIDPLECALIESTWENVLEPKDDATKWPYIKLHRNSTRPATADTRLGTETLYKMSRSRELTRDSQYDFHMLKSIPMRTLDVGGGMVRSVRMLVSRISPTLYLQAKDFTVGPRILCEEQLQLYLRTRQALTSKEQRCDDATSSSGANTDVAERSFPVPFVKLDVVCTHDISSAKNAKCRAVLTVWRPSESILGVLAEGDEYFVSSLSVTWKVDSGYQRGVYLRLGTTKATTFERIQGETPSATESRKTDAHVYCDFRARACETIASLADRFRGHDAVSPREWRLRGDVCVMVLHVVEGDVPLSDKVGDFMTTNHAFVTDASLQLMSIRVHSTKVQRRVSGRIVNQTFCRGSTNLWKPGSIVCISGLEVSHLDEGLDLLDCELVEATKTVSQPSQKSHFWDPHHQLCQLSASDHTSSFHVGTNRLMKHIKRYIIHDDLALDDEELQNNCEAEQLTQELCTQPSEVLSWLSQPTVNCFDGVLLQLFPLPDRIQNQFCDSVAIACVKRLQSAGGELETMYLTESVASDLSVLLEHEEMDPDFHELSSSVERFIESDKGRVFRFEVRWDTSERFLNSWRSWERLNSTFMKVVSINRTTAPNV